MSKVLLFSDIHCHCHKKSQNRLEDCLKTLDWVFNTAKTHQISNILFGGDLFHDRQKIDVYTYQRVFETLKNNLDKFDGTLWLLLGNHDMWFNDKTSISSVIPLSAINNITIINSPQRIKIAGYAWDFIPFTHNPVQSLVDLKTSKDSARFALGHIALDGAKLHGNTLSDVMIEHDGDMIKVNTDIFADYDQVFLGHYHAEQRINKVEYIGSPLELSFGEAFQEKHVIIFNCETLEKNYIINDFSPKHYIIRQQDLEKYDLNNNFIKLIVDEISATDLIDVRRQIIENHQVGSLEIKQNKLAVTEDIILDAKAILFKEEEMLTKYLSEVGSDGLEEELLLSIGKEICATGA